MIHDPAPDDVRLAETPQLIDGEALVVLLVILLGVLLAGCAAVILGCFWAYRAGRGSEPALGGWIAVGSFELLAALLAGFNAFLLVLVAALAIQLALFLRGRAKGPSAAPVPDGPPPGTRW